MSYANYFNSAGVSSKEVLIGNVDTDLLKVEELRSDNEGQPIKVSSTIRILRGSDIEIEREGEVISFNNLIERVKSLETLMGGNGELTNVGGSSLNERITSLELFMNTFNQAFVMGSLEEDGSIIQYNQ